MEIASVTPLTRLPWPGKFFDYTIPGQLGDLQRGDVVEVEFTHRRVNAVIWGISEASTVPVAKLKPLLGRTASTYRLTEQQLQLARWLSELTITNFSTVLLSVVPELPRRNVDPTPWLLPRIESPCPSLELRPILRCSYGGPSSETLAEDERTAGQPPLVKGATEGVTYTRVSTDVERLAFYRRQASRGAAAQHQLLLICPDQSSADELADALKGSIARLWHWRSDLNVNDQYRLHREIASGTPGLVVGTKSALFLPYQNLDAVIVDQAGSDWHYQWDARPRYDARTAAQELARLHGCQLLLCGPLPTVGQWQGVKSGNVRQMQIPPPPLSEGGRTNAQPSKITVHYLGQGQRTLIDPRVEQQIREVLERPGAVYVYCSRSGSGLLRCQDCGRLATPDTGYAIRDTRSETPTTCQRCHSVRLKVSGWNVARVAAELEKLLHIPVGRYESSQHSARYAIRDTSYETRVTHQTSSVSKIVAGTSVLLAHRPLDRWSLFVVLRADDDLLRSEYRATEEFAQLVATVSAAGVPVSIQADQEHPLLGALQQNQLVRWLDVELESRGRFSYPPAVQLWRWSYRSMEQAVELNAALAKALTSEFQIGEPYSASQTSGRKGAGSYLLVRAPVGTRLPVDRLTDKLFSQVVLESDPPRLFS